jgi:SRSO17 transposase
VKLYLPACWTQDAARRAAAVVPEHAGFATKPELARQMLQRALAVRCTEPLLPSGAGGPPMSAETLAVQVLATGAR